MLKSWWFVAATSLWLPLWPTPAAAEVVSIGARALTLEPIAGYCALDNTNDIRPLRIDRLNFDVHTGGSQLTGDQGGNLFLPRRVRHERGVDRVHGDEVTQKVDRGVSHAVTVLKRFFDCKRAGGRIYGFRRLS